MSAPSSTKPDTHTLELPPLPLTIEGASVLHQMFRVRWPEWKTLDAAARQAILDEAIEVLQQMELAGNGESAVFSLLGHKGDLMFVHHRNSIDELNHAELALANTRLFDFLDQT